MVSIDDGHDKGDQRRYSRRTNVVRARYLNYSKHRLHGNSGVSIA